MPVLPNPLLVPVHQHVTNRMEPSGGSYETSYIRIFVPRSLSNVLKFTRTRPPPEIEIGATDGPGSVILRTGTHAPLRLTSTLLLRKISLSLEPSSMGTNIAVRLSRSVPAMSSPVSLSSLIILQRAPDSKSTGETRVLRFPH